MKKILLLLSVIVILAACICRPVVSGGAEGRNVRVNIQDKIFKGELLSVTPELIIILFYDADKKKDVVVGCPVLETEVCKVPRGCGPIFGVLTKDKKFTFKGNPPDEINKNIVELSHDSLYASKIPDWVKEQMTLFNQL